MNAPAPKMGLATAAARAIAAWSPEALTPDGRVRPAQPLLPLQGESVGAEDEAEQEVEAQRGPGRPPGARNRSTEALLDAFGRQYRHPLFVLGSIWSRPADVLAHELGCTKLEAFQLQQRAAEAALPYTTKRMPQALEIDVPKMTVFLGGAMSGDGELVAPNPLEQRLAELARLALKNQALSGNATDVTDETPTDDPAQVLGAAGQSPAQAPDQRSGVAAGLAADQAPAAAAAHELSPPGGLPPPTPALSPAGVARAVFAPSAPVGDDSRAGKNRENSDASQDGGRGEGGA